MQHVSEKAPHAVDDSADNSRTPKPDPRHGNRVKKSGAKHPNDKTSHTWEADEVVWLSSYGGVRGGGEKRIMLTKPAIKRETMLN